MTRAKPLVVCLVCAAFACILATPALAADPPAQQKPAQEPPATPPPTEPRWSLEVYGGRTFNPKQNRGSGRLPVTGGIVGGRISASSLYFGDGARLFNQAVTAAGASAAQTITSLDATLLHPTLQRESQGNAFGARVARELGRRFAVEGTIEVSRGDFDFTDSALAAIEISRASYIPSLARALAAVPSSVSSVFATTPATAGQLFTTAALRINLKTSGNAIPYVTVGGGAVFNTGDTPQATLTGRYLMGNPAQIAGSDVVTFRYSIEGRRFVASGGGGVRFALSRHWGVRADGRIYFYRNTLVDVVDTNAGIGLTTTGAPFPLINSGTLQFSSTSPMNGEAIVGFPTFSGSGVQTHISATGGLVLRF